MIKQLLIGRSRFFANLTSSWLSNFNGHVTSVGKLWSCARRDLKLLADRSLPMRKHCDATWLAWASERKASAYSSIRQGLCPLAESRPNTRRRGDRALHGKP